jgi:hypothetical protein
MALNISGVKLKPHLSFSEGSKVQPVKLHDIYILAGNNSNKTGYIGAHGGALGNQTFRVPNGVTIRFTQPHGYSMSMNMSHLKHMQPIVDVSGGGQITYTAGQDCPNYFLTKWHGRHSGIGKDKAPELRKKEWEDAGEDYTGWQCMVAFNPSLTFIFPRNRWNKTGVPLDHVITSTLKKFPALTTFWCLFCRYDGSSEWNYDAQGGGWTLRSKDITGDHLWTWDPQAGYVQHY